MRPDMSKVIVERPRPGSERHVARRFRRLDPKHIDLSDDASDAYPRQIGHKRAAALAGDRKSLNENLTPLRRYLVRQVGRPWDVVWSEISEHLRPSSTVQQHVRDHIQDFVAMRTAMRAGSVYLVDRWGTPRPLADSSRPQLYVDPRSGLLCRNPKHRAYAPRQHRRREEAHLKALAGRMRVVDATHQLHLLADGNWWEVTLAPIPQETVPGRFGSRLVDMPVIDVVERAGLSPFPREDRYDRTGVYATAKRALSAREIRVRRLRD